jgi:D-arabinose 1-dehydrogenase-like Zn-dependent alcohol dehydrogenase
MLRDEKIRGGIIGAGGWAKYGHIPALQTLEEFEIVAVSSRKRELAEEYAAKFNILHAFDDPQALITHPDVDLVVILELTAGLARSRRARWKHGQYSAAVLAEQKRVRELLAQSRELLKQMQAG